MIWLQVTEKNVRIMNIVPITNTTLYPELYNYILNDFVSNVIEPVCTEHSLNFLLSDASVSLEQSIDEVSLKLLKTFSSNANKTTGHSHPSDLDRW
ncbi:MAG: hypothetical protein IPO49_09830 [Bacteroidetes bacterium]|nr:hypothetical protein [Bacteroidota bacterium]